ncbi:MAG: hypothetical protein ABLQ96_02355 [Candidatus Acidiferrum sp.]
MRKNKLGKMKKAKAIFAPKKGRQISAKLIHRDRKDLELKNYLMEDHPELGVPLEDAKSPKVNRVSRVARH